MAATDGRSRCVYAAKERPATQEEWSVFPNRASGEVIVRVNDPAMVYLTDAIGRRVSLPVTSESGWARLDLSGLRSGAYFVVAASSRGRQVRRVVVY